MKENEKNLVEAMREVRRFLAAQAPLLMGVPGYRNAYAVMYEAIKPYENEKAKPPQ